MTRYFHTEEFKRSDMTATEYAAANGLSLPVLYYWLREAGLAQGTRHRPHLTKAERRRVFLIWLLDDRNATEFAAANDILPHTMRNIVAEFRKHDFTSEVA